MKHQTNDAYEAETDKLGLIRDKYRFSDPFKAYLDILDIIIQHTYKQEENYYLKDFTYLVCPTKNCENNKSIKVVYNNYISNTIILNANKGK